MRQYAAQISAEHRSITAVLRGMQQTVREAYAPGQTLNVPLLRRLIDRGSEFLELSPLAGLGMHDDDGKKDVMGGGSIVGIGVGFATDPTKSTR